MTIDHHDLLVLGSGHAGSELAVAARQAGWQGSITLLGDEPDLPYHRPPLSKAYLCGTSSAEDLLLRPATAYRDAGIDWQGGHRVTRVDPRRHVVLLDDGTERAYRKLALCTGGRPRPLACAGIDPKAPPRNLLYLRTRADADRIRARLLPGSRLVVVGGGYVGLEIAASAVTHGVDVTVIEAQPRVLARVAGRQVSAFYDDVHRSRGVRLLTGVAIDRVDCVDGDIIRVHTTDGDSCVANVVVAGVGMLPNVEAAVAAGIATPAGILVDEHARTSDPDIVAAGDCTRFVHPAYGREVRIESVPNALEQARAAAGHLCGKPKPHRSIPWFWSDQYDLKLQMVGLSEGHDRCVIRGDIAAHSFCAFYFEGRRLLAAEAVNRPMDFMVARRALATTIEIEPDRLCDERTPLKEMLAA